MILPALSPGVQFSVDMLPHVKHRALPPLNYFLRALAAPGIRYFKQPRRAVFLLQNLRYDNCRMWQVNSIKQIGDLGERIAANYFIARGCKILEMNFENKSGYRLGEIDIVARDLKNEEIIFAEVKTRQRGTSHSSSPEIAISRAKYRKLSKIISSYLRKNNLQDSNYRLDAIAIELDMKTRKASLRHLKCIYY